MTDAWRLLAREQRGACLAAMGVAATLDALESGSANLALVHVRQGNRPAAAEIWERQLAAQPGDLAVRRHLAILYYWWALHEEAADGPDVDRLWTAAIVHWTRIMESDAFWLAWRSELAKRWKMELSDSDLQPLRERFLERRLTRVFESFASCYKEQGRLADAERHDDYLTTMVLERRRPLELPEPLAKILVLIEDRRLPDQAVERLDGLPEDVRNTPDAKRLRIRALLASARALQAARRTSEALTKAEMAWNDAQFVPALQEEAGELLDVCAKQEAARLQQQNGIADAAALLDRLCALPPRPAIRDYACALYCDLGFEKLRQDQFQPARDQFQKTLAIDAANARAAQGMGAAYHKEARAQRDAETKLKLLQKAFERTPDDAGLREDLAAAFYEKGLRVVRETTSANAKLELARAIGLFRAAAMTLNPSLTEETLDGIVRSADPDAYEIRKLPDGLYRTALENVASVARHRKQVRSE